MSQPGSRPDRRLARDAFCGYPLPLPQATPYRALGLTPEASPDEVRDALAALSRRPATGREGEETVQAIRDPKSRLAYDQANPPLELLKLKSCVPAALADNRAVLALLRRDIGDFLTSHGEGIFHPSDLTRQDFEDDFTYNPLLDE